MDIRWLGHSSFQIKASDKIIYIDPYKIKSAEGADVILITHGHYDHCSAEDISKIKKQGTVIIAPAGCSIRGEIIETIAPGQEKELGGISIKAYSAHNIAKPFHPKVNLWVGYLIRAGGKSVYHAGDTDFIPEMKDVKADIVLLPVGGTYTMDAKAAAQCAALIKPKKAVPMHYGSVVGSKDDASEFKALCEKEGIEVEILDPSSPAITI